jgi:protein-tyrosine phosphatase
VIDLHCHVLAGIDDGPAAIEGSIALAHTAARAGTEILVATPHVSARHPNRAASIASGLRELRACLERDADGGGPVPQLRAGAEVALAYTAELDDDELARLRLGGGPWLLLEPPTAPVDFDVAERVAQIAASGHRVLLAHPERSPAFRRDPEMLSGLVGEGVLTSVTAASLRGRSGVEVRRFAIELMRERLVHNVASDAHDHEQRPPTMLAELERAGFGPLARWLTLEVPAAILAGDEIPERPELDTLRVRRAAGERAPRRA